MVRILVIADDMTGNNDTGALLNREGLDTVAAISDDMREEWFSGRDALCLNTDSRAMAPGMAKERVKKAVAKYWKPGMLCCKRIDSTLRGNVGAEIDGMLEALPAGTKAVVVPAFPRAGRVCVGGHMLVHGIPLAESDAGRDSKTPVCSSRISDIISLQSNRRAACIELQEIEGEEERLVHMLRESDAEILVMDAVSERDIEKIAEACIKAKIPTACVDPGSFSVWMAKKLFLAEKGTGHKNLLMIGSLSTVTKRQTEYFIAKRDPLLYRISAKRLLLGYEEVKEEALSFLNRNMDSYEDICLLTDGSVMLKDGEGGITEAEEISRRFAEIGIALLNLWRDKITCVYLSGGDIAKDFLENMQIEGIDIIEEVIPLAVYGKTIDKEHNSIQILTKGGMIGNDSSIFDMIEYAKRVR